MLERSSVLSKRQSRAVYARWHGGPSNCELPQVVVTLRKRFGAAASRPRRKFLMLRDPSRYRTRWHWRSRLRDPSKSEAGTLHGAPARASLARSILCRLSSNAALQCVWECLQSSLDFIGAVRVRERMGGSDQCARRAGIARLWASAALPRTIQADTNQVTPYRPPT